MGWDHDRRATIDVLSNSFQQELQGKKIIIIIRAKDDKKIIFIIIIRKLLVILQFVKKISGDSIFGEMKIEEIDVRGNGWSIKFEINVDNVIGKNL